MDVAYIPFTFPGVENVSCAFQTRAQNAKADPYSGGNISFDVDDDPEKVLQNRIALQERLGFSLWQELKQVHGTDMIFEPNPGDVKEPGSIEADGLATTMPGQGLVMKSADCQPLLLAHVSGKYVAALHVGWMGNRLHFPALGIGTFCRQYGLDPKEVLVVRGPSLGPGASEFTNFDEDFGENFRAFFNPRTKTVNLWLLTMGQILTAGIAPENVFSLDLCTHSLPETFFSFRRNKVCGRQASIIWIRD